MRDNKLLFICLGLLIIILEISCVGFDFTKSILYFISIIIATIGITFTIYSLHILNKINKPIKPHKEYYFYYINNSPQDQLFEEINSRF